MSEMAGVTDDSDEDGKQKGRETVVLRPLSYTRKESIRRHIVDFAPQKGNKDREK